MEMLLSKIMHVSSSYLRQNSVMAVGRLLKYSYRHFGKAF